MLKFELTNLPLANSFILKKKEKRGFYTEYASKNLEYQHKNYLNSKFLTSKT